VLTACIITCLLQFDTEHLLTLTQENVAQLVEALRYKPEGRWFDSRWSH
jgi:hypothetical protein